MCLFLDYYALSSGAYFNPWGPDYGAQVNSEFHGHTHPDHIKETLFQLIFPKTPLLSWVLKTLRFNAAHRPRSRSPGRGQKQG